MFKKMLLAILVLLLMVPMGLAQDDKPTVAILRFGPMFNFNLIQGTMFNSLQVHGFLSEAEADAGLSDSGELDGEGIRIALGDANLSFANVNFIVDEALDKGADALVTFSTPVTQAAIHATSDMDDPPIVIFASVYNPYEAGIARASCLKAAHVTGLESVTLYEDIVPLLFLQNPDIKTIGTVYSASETSGSHGAAEIMEIAEGLGLTVEQAAVTSVADLAPAAEGLIARGVEAFLIPSDLLTVAGLPSLMQVGIENGIPIFHSTGNSVNEGATISAGVGESGVQGRLLGAMLAGILRGDIDVSRAGIGSVSKITVSVSKDTAELQDVEISEALLERADMIYEDGVATGRRLLEVFARIGLSPELAKMAAARAQEAIAGGGKIEVGLPPQILKALREAQASQPTVDHISGALADLHCTDEMIAQQQAELDAAEG